jgi:hypothetical protein
MPEWALAGADRRAVAAIGWLVLATAFGLYLRGEEARVTRELRVARSGTSVQRRALLRRRRPAPYFGVAMFWYAAVRILATLASTTLGYAAVLLAEGEVGAAEGVLAGFGQSLSTGPLASLRRVVRADALRARGTEDSLGEAIRALLDAAPLTNAEAERYRLHVLVQALLELGDESTARDVAETLRERGDDELAPYLTWLTVWFDWSHLDPPSEGDLRRALLLGRAHGAEALVAKLTAALAEKSPA